MTRVCGNYKLTMNQVSILESYSLPRIEDLFTSLAGGVLLSKIDLAYAYQQLLLDKNPSHHNQHVKG